MKQNFRFEQDRESKKKQYKQEVIEYILEKPYGVTIGHEQLASMLHYNIDDEEEYHKYKTLMQSIKNWLLGRGRVLRSVPNVGYYILKPSQVSQHCYRTYIKSAGRLYDKSAYVLDRTDKTELSDIRKEEIHNMIQLNKQLIDNAWNTIQESAYYSRKQVYDNLEEN
jgi:hypothetical protein